MYYAFSLEAVKLLVDAVYKKGLMKSVQQQFVHVLASNKKRALFVDRFSYYQFLCFQPMLIAVVNAVFLFLNWVTVQNRSYYVSQSVLLVLLLLIVVVSAIVGKLRQPWLVDDM